MALDSRALVIPVAPHDQAMANQDVTIVSPETNFQGRLNACKAMSKAMYIHLSISESNLLCDALLSFVNSGYAIHRLYSAILVQQLIQLSFPALSHPIFKQIETLYMTNLQEYDTGLSCILYQELHDPLRHLRNETQALLNAYSTASRSKNIQLSIPSLPSHPCDPPYPTSLGPIFNADIANDIIQRYIPIWADSGVSEPYHVQVVQNSILSYTNLFELWETRVLSSISSSILSMHLVPPKLNPLVRSLMSHLKTEQISVFQQRSATFIAVLTSLLIEHSKPPAINAKIVSNCVALLSPVEQFEWMRQVNGIVSLSDVKLSDSAVSSTRGAKKATEKLLEGVDPEAALIVNQVDQKHRDTIIRGGEFVVEAFCKEVK